jgi:hypothetical protein
MEEASMHGLKRSVAQRQVPPWSSAAQDPQHAIHDGTVTLPLSAAAAIGREKICDAIPLFIR